MDRDCSFSCKRTCTSLPFASSCQTLQLEKARYRPTKSPLTNWWLLLGAAVKEAFVLCNSRSLQRSLLFQTWSHWGSSVKALFVLEALQKRVTQFKVISANSVQELKHNLRREMVNGSNGAAQTGMTHENSRIKDTLCHVIS